MNLDDIEELIRRYFSTGLAVVLVLVAPGAVDDRANGDDPVVIRLEPEASAEPDPRPDPRAPDDGSAPSTSDIDEYEPPGAGPDEEPRPDPDPDTGTDTGTTEPDADTHSTPDGDVESRTDPTTGGESESESEPGSGTGDTADEGGVPDPGPVPDPGSDPDSDSDSDSDSDTNADGDTDSDTDTAVKHRQDTADQDTGDQDTGGGGPSAGPGEEPAAEQTHDHDSSGPSPNSDLDPDLRARGPANDSVPGIDDGPAPTGEGRDAVRETEVAGEAGAEGVTAADRLGWGTPVREDDFTSGSNQWNLYEGPGHAGEGERSPSAVTISDGVLVLTGDSQGTTGGMSWGEGQMYGRWEGRVRAPASDPSYNALLLLWPDAEDFPAGGEIDFMEMLDPTRRTTDFFLHFDEDDKQVNGQVEVDGTQWHNWAVEWTPDAITAYVDGEEWFRTTDPSTFPSGPMHLCIQLDWFPDGSSDAVQESRMEVDWVRQYALDREPSAGSSVPTEGARVAPAVADEEPGPIRRMFSWG